MTHLKKLISLTLCLVLVAGIFTFAPVKANALTPTYECSESYKNSQYYTNLCGVELTGNCATDIVNIARSQVGYKEGATSKDLSGAVQGGENYTEYSYFFNNGSSSYGAWCAYFVNWCARMAGISTRILYGKDGYVPNLAKFYKTSKMGTWYPGPAHGGTYAPRKGDIVIIDFDYNYNHGDHVGIVSTDATSPDYITVIGGNEADSVCEGYFSSTFTGQRHISSVMGYFRPNYGINGLVDNVTYPDNYPVPTNVLKQGSTGEGVKWIQAVLFTFGFLENEADVDGIFGAGTKEALIQFQLNNGLDADGIAGPATIKILEDTWLFSKAINNRYASLSKVSNFSLRNGDKLNLVEDPTGDGLDTITWESTDETIATVDSNGIVTAHKEGTVTIFAILPGGEEIAHYTITVEAATLRLIYGDVNCDGGINMQDVTSLQEVLASLKTYEAYGSDSQAQSDVTRDYSIGMDDVVLIQRFIAKLETIE